MKKEVLKIRLLLLGPGSSFEDFFGPNFPKEFFGNRPHPRIDPGGGRSEMTL